MFRRLAVLCAVLVLIAVSPAEAHRPPRPGAPAPQGISIPSLTHGQMAVIGDHLSEIKALAASRIGFDMETWRIEDYLNLQSFACFWGFAPGAVADEESPFNECAHAYLAAGRALLLQLRQAPGVDHKAVEELIQKIETEMLLQGASLNLCRFSDEPFDTNAIVWPHWSEIPFHPPTAAAFAAVLAVPAGALAWLALRGRRPTSRAA